MTSQEVGGPWESVSYCFTHSDNQDALSSLKTWLSLLDITQETVISLLLIDLEGHIRDYGDVIRSRL